MSFTDQSTPDTNGNFARGNAAIDLQAALDILGQRSASHVNPDLDPTSRDDPEKSPNTPLNSPDAVLGCGCCIAAKKDDPNVASSSWNASMKFQGQCIEIGSSADVDDPLASLNDTKLDSETADVENEFNASLWKNQKEQTDAQQRARARQEELACKLQSMSLKDIIGTVFQAQEGRVETYRFFDEALEEILTTGNVQYYPPVCANVTATFSVLSSTINAVRSDLERRERQPNVREIQELLTRLQRAEQSKLQLTAALHLERMRFVAEVQQQKAKVDQSCSEPIDTSSGNELERQSTVSKLLNESILVLRNKIGLAIGEINDVLEDLRYSILEEVED